MSHYIINSIGTGYKIGENTFPDLHSIIEFYKNHFLDSTNLTEPVSKACICYIRVKGKHDVSLWTPIYSGPRETRIDINYNSSSINICYQGKPVKLP